jgi:hypothetical protein
MPKAKPRRATTRARPSPPSPTLGSLKRRLTRLEAELVAERESQARRVASAKRAADRRLAAMMQEIASLRHHEARAEALTRLLATRDRELAARAARIAELEAALTHVDNRDGSVRVREATTEP